MKDFLRKKWRNAVIVVLICLVLVMPSIPAMADMIQIRPITTGLWEVDGSETQLITADEIDMQTKKIINVVDPTNNQDAATKKYIDDTVSSHTLDQAYTAGQTIDIDAGDLVIDLAAFDDFKITRSSIGATYLHFDAGAVPAIIWGDSMMPSTDATYNLGYLGAPSNRRWEDIAFSGDLTDGTNSASVAEIVASIDTVYDADYDTLVQVEESADEDKIRFDTAGTERLVIDNTGLDVTGNIAVSGTVDGVDIAVHATMVGSTFPASPVDGQVFTHEVTGRKITYVYDLDNTTWIPIISIGTTTLYVDKTDGSDSLEDHGTGVDGDAFATIQFAVDCIPGLVGGNVVIYINDEDYDEAVMIFGKNYIGSYSITLRGTLSESSSGTQSANGVQGTGGSQGSFTDTGNLAGVANLLCYLDADGDYRVIDSTDGDTATICGTFTSQPLQNENYVIYNWGTSLNRITVNNGQKGVNLYDIELDTSNGLNVAYDAVVRGYRLKIGVTSWGVYIQNGGQATLYYTYITSSDHIIDVYYFSYLLIHQCKVYASATGKICVRVRANSFFYLTNGSILDAVSATGNYGLYIYQNSSCDCWASVSNGYPRVENQNIGIYAFGSGQVSNTANNDYSGTSTPESAVAASYGYID